MPDYLFSACLAVTLLTLGACAGPRRAAERPAELPAGFPNHTPTQIRQFILGSSEQVNAIRARASFNVESPEQSGRFSSEIRARREDSLLITISPGLGIEAARALITPDSLFLYNRIQNELVFGAVEDAGSTLGFPLGEEDLFGNLLGIFFPRDLTGWTVRAEDETYLISDPSGLRRYTVDLATWRVLRYDERSGTGELVEERVYSEFETFGGVVLPRRVQFSRPGDETTASLYYRELEVNPGPLSFALRVSGSAERTPLPSR